MNIYQTWSLDGDGEDATQCIAAHSHEEAVEILIETSARNDVSVPNGGLDGDEAQWLLEERDWLRAFDRWRRPVNHVAVYELRMPSTPEYVDYCDRRVVEFDVEKILKRRGVIHPDFSLDSCEDEVADT